MSENDQNEANLAMQEFVAKVITADRIGFMSEVIKSLDLVPVEMRDECQELLAKMISHLEQ